jgi:hypothetical protein
VRKSLQRSGMRFNPSQQAVVRSLFSDVSTSNGVSRQGASQGCARVGRAHQKGVDFRIRHASSFAPRQLVIQQVIPSYLFIEAPMEQMHLSLLCRLDAPAVVPPALLAQCKTYRDAVKLCWELRQVRNLTGKLLAERAGLYPSHVSCYLKDGKRQRDLPGWAVKGFEWACGNTAISQWHNVNAKLTVVEEMSLLRKSA